MDDRRQVSTATAQPQSPKNQQVPGLGPALAVMILSAGLSTTGLMSLPGPTDPINENAGRTSQIEQVSDRDLDAALGTIEMGPDEAAKFRQLSSDCKAPLAYVWIKRAPGQPVATVRLRSGSYFSPVFTTADVPVRVAIPYPAPYEDGRGRLTAMVAGGKTVLGLRPAWLVSEHAGGATREVVWHPDKRCARSGG